MEWKERPLLLKWVVYIFSFIIALGIVISIIELLSVSPSAPQPTFFDFLKAIEYVIYAALVILAWAWITTSFICSGVNKWF